MTCQEALALLWPLEGPQLADEEVVEARRHVGSCPHCRQVMENDRRLRERLRKISLPPAPAELRERVFEALAEERRQRARSDRAPRVSKSAAGTETSSTPGLPGSLFPGARELLVAATLVAVVVGGWLLMRPGEPDVAGGARTAGEDSAADITLVEDFVREAARVEGIESSDPQEVMHFLAAGLGLMLHPRDFGDFELVGAEICALGQKRGAVILYERDGQRLYHFLLRAEDATPRTPHLSDALPLSWEDRDPVSAAIWSSGALDEALVGELPPEEILALALAAPGPR